MTEQLSLLDARQSRDVAIEQVSAKAEIISGPFAGRAADFIVAYLREHGPTNGEDLTDACKAAGIIPHNDKAFGSVYMALAIRGKIRKTGVCKRKKGHATGGGNIWEAK